MSEATVEVEIIPSHLQRKCSLKPIYKDLSVELNPCHLKVEVELNPLCSFTKIIFCHNPDRRFSHRDCSHLSVGDRVMGNVLGIKFKLGILTRLDYEDHGTWKEIISMNVRLDDGRDVNPYPDQLLKLVSDGLIKH